MRILYFLITVLFLISCSPEDNKLYLSVSFGRVDEIEFVTNIKDWEAELGDSIRKYFASDYPFLPQPEPTHDIRFVKPESFSNMMNKHHNILFFGALNGEGEADIFIKRMIKSNKELSDVIKEDQYNIVHLKDVWAKPQLVTIVMAPSQERLINEFSSHVPQLLTKTYVHETRKLIKSLYIKPENSSIKDSINRLFDIEVRIPQRYEMVKIDQSFLWIRNNIEKKQQNTLSEINILIYSSPYRGEASLSLDSVMNTRKKVLKQHIHGEFENTYMITDTTELPEGRLVQDFNKNTVREVRGLWEMKNEFMGGPFISYSVHDKLNNRVITLEGFVFAPGERKKVYIRQLEVILKSLKLKQE